MRTLIALCLTIVVVFTIVFVSSNSLSTSEMAATWGGGNCKKCPSETNSTCGKNPCSGGSSGCSEYSGGSYKVCEQGTHPDQNCTNTDSVSCGTHDTCAVNEGDCKGADAYDCSCHSTTHYMTGCS